MTFAGTAMAAKEFGVSQDTVLRKLKSGEWPGHCSRTGRWFVNIRAIMDLMTNPAPPKYKKR
jgi:GH24 family phage-related lysozyme (muramidase)